MDNLKQLIARNPFWTLRWMLWTPYCWIFGHDWIAWQDYEYGDWNVDGCRRCFGNYPEDL